MRRARVVILSLLCIVVAAVPGQIMYAIAAKKNLLDPSFFLGMMVASSASYVVFSAAKLIPSHTAQLLTGIGGSYFALIGLVFLVVFKGDIAEFMLWLPVVIVFGIPFMAPLIGLSWLGSTLVLGAKKRWDPNEAAPTDR